MSHAAQHRYARLPAAFDQRTLHYSDYRPAAAPAVPPRADFVSAVPEWPMYGNDERGDCTIAGGGHMIESWTLYAQGHEVSVTDDDVLHAYEAVSGYDPATGANDNGANELEVLKYWRRVGIGGHRIAAFMRVNVHNHREVQAAIATFGGIYTGLRVAESAENQFAAGDHWHVDPGPAGRNILGLHCVPVLAYDPANLTCVTWAKAQPMTWHFWDTYFDEAWAIVTRDFLDAAGHSPAGLNLRQLLADLDTLD